ncbi:PAS domain S-box protein [Methylobacterium durans]|uniref:PAS domain S-box protein n=1 Tax=Methylobacterium durans TaxID=2202825 RepID=UPI002AFDF80C|nr:PAS domain S-box protein [Methylobacterium durans]MEA1835143.1 PAS domain S-box protein [Methylobacterium durans]
MTSVEDQLGFLVGGSLAESLIRAHRWMDTPLGEAETWPQSLRLALSICLNSSFPTAVYWGQDLRLFYNDAWAPILAERHPWALGRPAAEVWADIWEVVGPQLASVVETGAGFSTYDQMLSLVRDGARQETYWNYSFTPVRGEDGSVAGVFAQGHETTDRVLAERRGRFLLDLSDRLRALSDPQAVIETAQAALGHFLHANRVGYGEVEETARYFTTERNWTDGSVPSRAGTHDLAGFGPEVLAALRAGIPLLITDAGSDPRTNAPESLAAFDAIDTRAAITACLVKDGRMRAALYVHAREPRPWTRFDTDLVIEVAERTWAAVERARAEARLRDSEAQFRLMADAVPQIVWITDAQGRTEFFNRQWTQYTGKTYEPSTAADIAVSFVHPDDSPATVAAFNEARRTGGSFRVEHRIRSAAGDYRWFLVRGEPYRDPQSGALLRWFGASVDIHDRKVAEEQLRALNADLERQVVERSRERGLIWQHSLDLLSVIDLGTATFDTVNPAWTATLGWTKDEIEGRSYQDFVHPDDRTASAEAFEQVRRGDPVLRFQNRYRTKDGAWRWLSWVAVPEGAKLYAVTRDISVERERQTELEAAETARREADALYRAYFENTPEALFVIGVEPDGGFVVEQINPAHEAGVGFKLVDVRGKRIEEILPPDIAERVLASYRRVLATGEIYQYREVFNLSGDPQHWDTSLVPVQDAGGRVTRLIGSSRNVTRQVVAEEALRQAQKMEAVGQLTGGVAHDFNNLLTIIRSSVDFLRRPDLPEARKGRYLDAVSDTVERAAKLTGQLLAFARRQALKPEVFDAGARLKRVADLLDTVTGSRIRVVSELPEQPCYIRADVSQFETALVNMAVNARDAMDGEGTLTIKLARVSELPPIRGHAGSKQPFAAVSLTDTGAGIPADQTSRIFEPFFTTKEVGKGTGLGLSQVFGFAKQSGGDVDVVSRLGEGATFTLYLPEVIAGPEQLEARRDQSALSPMGRGQRVLVVEDNLEIGRFATQILEDFGYVSIWAANAEEALEKLGSDGSGFDVVFSDVVMPGMGGLALAEELKRRLPTLPVVLTSGYSHVLAQDGVHGFELLHKPYSAEQLGRLLSRVVLPPSSPQPSPLGAARA